MTLEIGRPIPDFTLKDQHGQDVSPTDFRGQKNLVIVFYPYAFSRVCTGELCELRDHLEDFSDESTALIAVSCDQMFSLRAFAEQDGDQRSRCCRTSGRTVPVPAPTAVSTRRPAARLGLRSSRTGRGSSAGRSRTRCRKARDLDDYRKVLAALS